MMISDQNLISLQAFNLQPLDKPQQLDLQQLIPPPLLAKILQHEILHLLQMDQPGFLEMEAFYYLVVIKRTSRISVLVSNWLK